MDARTVLIDAMKARGLPNPEWEADAIINRLLLAGFTIILRDENHGPTLERAAEVAVDAYAEAATWDYFEAADAAIAAAIRAMEVK